MAIDVRHDNIPSPNEFELRMPTSNDFVPPVEQPSGVVGMTFNELLHYQVEIGNRTVSPLANRMDNMKINSQGSMKNGVV